MTKIHGYTAYTNHAEKQKNRLWKCANPDHAREDNPPRLISSKEPARTSTAMRNKRMVTPAPNVPEYKRKKST